MRLLHLTLGGLVVLLVCASSAGASSRSAAPSTLGDVFASARGGDTIVLAAGDYGRFSGGAKSSTVTIKPEAGATASMDVDLRSASQLRVEGMTIGDLDISDSSRDVTFAGNRITGHVVIHTEQMNNANVVLDGNSHIDINACGSCYEGRITLPGKGPNLSGVTIRNSLFRGGNADGIQNGSRGTAIVNNEFVDIHESGGVHSDPIQLYGSAQTLVRGNWIHDTSTGIMAPDGADHEVIEHNVIDPGGYPYAITLWSDDGSIVRHNTLPDGACDFNLRCGILTLGSKSGQSAGRATVIKDNILGEVTVGDGSAAIAEQNYNLIGDDSPVGASDARGRPKYVGGAAPATLMGFKLATGSPGRNNASDGTDRGAAIGAVAGGPGAPTPGAPAPGAPTPGAGSLVTGSGPAAKLSVDRRVTWRQLRRGLRVRVTSPVRARVTLGLRRKGTKRAMLRRTRTMRAGRRTFLLRPRAARLGRRRTMKVVLTVRVTDGAGAATRLRRTIRVRR